MTDQTWAQSSFCKCDCLNVPPAPRHAHQKLIKNVSIFNGESEDLITGYDLVLQGHKIVDLIPAGGSEDGYDAVIDGKGGFLTPGLIDIHWHTMLSVDPASILTKPVSYIAAIACAESKRLLMRGVTTIRDAAGDVFGIQQAIDQGIIQGPRIYGSGPLLSQYSGHGDYRNLHYMPREWGGRVSDGEAIGAFMLCNGADQVLAATRHALSLGATQIKMATSGGVTSFTDPLYVNEFFEEEISAAVRAAEDYGTYVMVHCHGDSGARRALKAGVKSFSHISQLEEETVKLLAGTEGVEATVQVLIAVNIAENYPKGDPRQLKAVQCVEATKNVMKWAKKYGLQLSWGTDLLDSQELRDKQLSDLTMRLDFGFSSAELMVQATGNGGKCVAMCGKRNPYGKLGCIEKGAMADLLIYSKNPLEDIKIVEDFENNLKLIIKDGDIVKNSL